MYNEFENIEAIKEIFDMNTGICILNNVTNEFIGKMYLIIYIDGNNNDDNNIINIFDSLTINYNNHISNISCEFLNILLYLYNNVFVHKNIDKLLQNNPIYFPLNVFSHNNPIYVKNQQLSLILNGVKNCSKIELLYDKLQLKSHIDLTIKYPENKIPIEIISILNVNINNIVDIDIDINTHINDNLQELLWIYKDKNLNLCHPVKDISIIGITNRDLTKIIRDKSLKEYFTFTNSWQFHTNSENTHLYSYSFVLQPEKCNFKQSLSNMVKTIRLEQSINEECDIENCMQIIVLKSFCYVELH